MIVETEVCEFPVGTIGVYSPVERARARHRLKTTDACLSKNIQMNLMELRFFFLSFVHTYLNTKWQKAALYGN